MCYKRHPVQTGYLCLSQRSTEAPYPLYPSLHQSMLKSKSSNLKMWLKHNYIRSGIFNVAVYLFVCKASPLFLCLNLKCRVCTGLFVSGSAEMEMRSRSSFATRWHSTIPPPVEQQASHYFLWQTQIHTKYTTNTQDSITQFHYPLFPLSAEHQTVHNLSTSANACCTLWQMQMYVELCDKCKCTYGCSMSQM